MGGGGHVLSVEQHFSTVMRGRQQNKGLENSAQKMNHFFCKRKQ